MKKIIFICSGNICRSPMAEYYFKHILELSPIAHQVEVSSAGTCADCGSHMSPEAYEVLCEELGTFEDRHVARQLTFEMVYNNDLIIVMTRGHKSVILQHFPDVQEKVHLLSEYCDANGRDISDPWGQDIGVYSSCLRRMKNNLTNLLLRLIKEIQASPSK